MRLYVFKLVHTHIYNLQICVSTGLAGRAILRTDYIHVYVRVLYMCICVCLIINVYVYMCCGVCVYLCVCYV